MLVQCSNDSRVEGTIQLTRESPIKMIQMTLSCPGTQGVDQIELITPEYQGRHLAPMLASLSPLRVKLAESEISRSTGRISIMK